MMSFWFTLIRDLMINKQGYAELGLSCANIRGVLDQGMDRMKLDDLIQSVREAINRLMTWVGQVMHGSTGSALQSEVKALRNEIKALKDANKVRPLYTSIGSTPQSTPDVLRNEVKGGGGQSVDTGGFPFKHTSSMICIPPFPSRFFLMHTHTRLCNSQLFIRTLVPLPFRLLFRPMPIYVGSLLLLRTVNQSHSMLFIYLDNTSARTTIPSFLSGTLGESANA